MSREPTASAAQPESLFDDVWARRGDLCPFCAAEIDPRDDRCPGCENRLWVEYYRYEKPGSNLHVLWVLLAGLGQLFFVGLFVQYVLNGSLLLAFLYGFLSLVAIGLAAGIYFRQFWAYAASIPILIVLVFLMALGAFTSLIELPQSADPAIDSFLASLLQTGSHFLSALQLAAASLALLWALFFVGAEFARDRVRLSAHVKRGMREPGALFAAGHRYAKRGMWASAILHWQRAAAGNPTNATYLRDLGEAYGRLGFNERALDALQTAHSLALDETLRREIAATIATHRKQLAYREVDHGRRNS